MREAAAAMQELPAAKRTLDEFERRTGELADARNWHRASFSRQHLRNHPELEAIYRRARFPGRKPEDRVPHGAKMAREPELAAKLAEVDAQLVTERKARREAEDKAERARIGYAADVVREFILQMGLTPKSG